MKLWNKFKKLNSTDRSPGLTKFLTKYVMPLMIIACGYGFCYVGELMNSTLSDYSYVKTSVGKIEFQERSNNKAIETIHWDLYLTTTEGLNLHKKNIRENSLEKLLINLASNEIVDIFYESQTGIIKELRKNGEPLISFQKGQETNRRGRIMLAIFFFGFLFWYLSRMYRYRKYGTI